MPPRPGKPAPRQPSLKPVQETNMTEHSPVDPQATPEAKALLRFLYTLSGHRTLTGQHNFPDRQNYCSDLATAQNGKTPAVYGTDWGFAAVGDKDSAYVRHKTVQTLIQQWNLGSVITLCWHAVPPTEDEPVTFSGSVQSRLTDVQFQELLTPDTPVQKHWYAQIDMIAEYLRQLQEARVPVLWRPLHEINGDWFWWNGVLGDPSHGTKQLYRLLYDRLVNFHQLHNLLWVWNPDRPNRADRQFSDYFPGQEYVDVLALDCYGPFEQSYYDDLNALSDGKVLAIGETAQPPTLEIYQYQPKWTYYMKWAVDTPADGGSAQKLAADLDDPRLLSLQDPAYTEGINPVRAVSGLDPLIND
jgi:mannan endo-1,4-beta-mannosidase